MPKISFAFNDDTSNTTIEILDDAMKIDNAVLKLSYLKASDDEDYYEFDLNEGE